MFYGIRKGLVASVIGLGLLAGNSQAVVALPTTSYSGLVIFGDSLSDPGNILSLTTAFTRDTPFPTFPGAAGRFSNGPAWTEYLASGLGFATSANPSNLFFNPPGSPFPFHLASMPLARSAARISPAVALARAWAGRPARPGSDARSR